MIISNINIIFLKNIILIIFFFSTKLFANIQLPAHYVSIILLRIVHLVGGRRFS